MRENIAKGYGVEDIAVMYRMAVKDVQAEVAALREAGAFEGGGYREQSLESKL